MGKTLAFVAVLAGTAIGGSALAADLSPYNAPPNAAPFNWSGPYFGLAVGYGWAGAAQTYTITSPTLAAAPPIIPVIEASGSQPLALRGSLVDAEAGYDWQTSDLLVFGVEGDAEWTDINGSQFNGGNVPNYPPGYPYSIAQKFQPEWDASLRARAGITPVDRLLLFVTTGPALALLHYTSAYTDYWSENEDVAINAFRPGWTAGAGAEYAVAPNWSIKAEYRYTEFAAAHVVGSALLTDGTTAYGIHSTGVLKENTVRLGLNWRID